MADGPPLAACCCARRYWRGPGGGSLAPNDAPPPTADTLAFVTESRRDAIRRRRRVASLFGAFAALIVAGIAAWWNEKGLKERGYALATVHALTATKERALKPKDVFKECTDCPEMVAVPAGIFIMGSPLTEKRRDSDETPLHKVTIAKSFAVSKFALTVAEWDVCVDYGDCDPYAEAGVFGRGSQPLVNIDWYDARDYVAWLSRITGKQYHLLTEAEYDMRRGPERRRFTLGAMRSAPAMPVAPAAAASGMAISPPR